MDVAQPVHNLTQCKHKPLVSRVCMSMQEIVCFSTLHSFENMATARSRILANSVCLLSKYG